MHLRFAAIGPGTAEQLRKQGFYADLMPEEYYAADLGRALAQQMQPGERLLLPRAKMGSQELTDILQQQGIHCTDLPLYDTVYTSHNCDKVRQMIEENAISCAVFTSASTVEGFVRPDAGLPAAWAACAVHRGKDRTGGTAGRDAGQRFQAGNHRQPDRAAA